MADLLTDTQIDQLVNDSRLAEEGPTAFARRVEKFVLEKAQPNPQLCKFYSVTTYPELVAQMDRHITRLQAKLPPIKDTQPGLVRGG